MQLGRGCLQRICVFQTGITLTDLSMHMEEQKKSQTQEKNSVSGKTLEKTGPYMEAPW